MKVGDEWHSIGGFMLYNVSTIGHSTHCDWLPRLLDYANTCCIMQSGKLLIRNTQYFKAFYCFPCLRTTLGLHNDNIALVNHFRYSWWNIRASVSYHLPSLHADSQQRKALHQALLGYEARLCVEQ